MFGSLHGRRGPWKRPPLWLASAAGAILLIGWQDSRIQPDVDLSLFHAAAVAATGWWLGRRYAVIAAVLAAAAWTIADLGRHASEGARFAYWNGTTRLGIFLLIGLLVARVRADRRRLTRSRRVLEEEILRARTDPLTELPNGRGFLELLDRELSDEHRRGLSFCLACIDLEGLRKYQDRHETSNSDDLVKRVAGVLRRAVRASDIPARLDRDEFAVAFRDVERDVVEKTLRRIISNIATLADDPDAPVSATVGLVCFADPPEDPQEALRQAEKVLHEAHAADETLRVRDSAAPEPPAGIRVADPA